MIYRTYYLSPLGRMLLAADDMGLWEPGLRDRSILENFQDTWIFLLKKMKHILKDALRC